MSSYILVHGAWHGAWCWHKVEPLLKAAGHNVITPELPGHGNDKTLARNVSVQDYVDTLSKAILEQTDPVVLVGHSMAGMVISQTAEYLSDRIKTLVYLTGFLLGNGQCIRDIESRVSDSLVSSNLVLSQDRHSLTVPADLIRKAFYNDCTNDDSVFAMSRLTPEPALPFLTPINITPAEYGRVPRVYIECLLDQALPITAQREMIRDAGCHKLYSLNVGHSPFLSKHEELSRILLGL